MMQTYAEYKDSGVDWLGEIPAGWELRRNKFIFEEKTNSVGKDAKKFKLLSLTLGGIIPRDMENPKGKFPAEFDTYKQVSKNDLVFCLFDVEETPRAVGISGEAGMITGAYTVLKASPNSSPSFLNYLYLSVDNGKQLKSLYTGLRNVIKIDTFMSLKTPFPDVQTQTAIADFLDDKTAKIDELVGIKRRQIALLGERKQILIQNAVTKGLNPNAPLKDSGVDWIGKIPAHWEVKRLRYLLECGKGLTITKENLQDEGVPCVNYGEIHSKYGFELDPKKNPLKAVSPDYLESSPSALLKYGDFIFADTSEDLEGSGNFTYLNSDQKVFAGYHTVIARPKSEMNYRHLAYFFDSMSYRSQMRRKVKGVKVYSITQSIIKGTHVILPPEQEQKEIARFLDIESNKINAAITIKQNQITKLNEYKTTLINAAVTGKIKVA